MTAILGRPQAPCGGKKGIGGFIFFFKVVCRKTCHIKKFFKKVFDQLDKKLLKFRMF